VSSQSLLSFNLLYNSMNLSPLGVELYVPLIWLYCSSPWFINSSRCSWTIFHE